jgi:DNA-binding response OmpR family regulator
MMARILVVDDEAETRSFIADFMQLKGYQVLTAADGLEAIHAVKNERPHIVLLDMKIQGPNGIEVLQRIRAIDKEIGIIMITAVKDEWVGEYVLKLGACDYITKPIDLDDLEQSVYAKLLMMAVTSSD